MRLTPRRDESAEQARLRARIQRQRGGVHGPFQVLLTSPALGDPLERLSTACLAESALPPRLRELNSAGYDRVTYEAMNSRYARGAAETVADRLTGLLRALHAEDRGR
ncbi:hypothetical protein [Streptomyces sp. NPDC059894]|uniref:hypothetical protein n=1 Tax=unclassified Streptomyces TaxID=2593676 RepID=UPI00364615CC